MPLGACPRPGEEGLCLESCGHTAFGPRSRDLAQLTPDPVATAVDVHPHWTHVHSCQSSILPALCQPIYRNCYGVPFNRIRRLFTHNQIVAECHKNCIRAILDGRIEVGASQIVSGLSWIPNPTLRCVPTLRYVDKQKYEAQYNSRAPTDNT
ncbi:unnamed protein product [Penicillium camemberti]|uniref:Str. FM013 n=1 Tax=Penicillium camemberti (strain FM 013) TaxID=1429867 RepID=A0A0G4PSN1_PENC3|nr:unnamed protein product [Penicillium camemberti]